MALETSPGTNWAQKKVSSAIGPTKNLLGGEILLSSPGFAQDAWKQ